MQCEEVREQFAEYVTEKLEDPVRSRVSEHVESCRTCRQELEELKTLWMELGNIPQTEPSPDARARFDEMLNSVSSPPQLRRGGSTASWLARRARSASAIARSLKTRSASAIARSLKSGAGQKNNFIGQHHPSRGRYLGFALSGSRFAAEALPSSAEEGSFQPWRRYVLQVGVVAASLVLGVAIGYHLRPATGANTELAELRNELYQTRQMVALSLMQQQAATDRLKGISWSYQLQQPSAELLRALLDTLMHDPSVNVRLATVDALRQFGDQPVVRRGVVEAMARQQSPMVEISLIDLAVDLGEKESIAALRQLTQDQALDHAVRERAQKGLTELEYR